MKTKTNIPYRLVRPVLTLVLFLGAAVASKATTILSYNAGSNGIPASAPDPTSVAGGSWILNDTSAGDANFISSGLSPDPLYPNLNTWRTLDNSTAAGKQIHFSASATDEQVTNAIWCGWKASTYLRVVDPVAGNAGSSAVFVQLGSTNLAWNRRYVVGLDIDANGALYNPNTGIIITTNTTDALAYHLCELIYDNATVTAQLYVDGQVISSNYPSLTIPATFDGCRWGVSSSSGRGDGYFNMVKVEVSDLSPTTVTLNPTNTTRNVAESVTFTADFTGCATNLQWYHDGSPILGANQRSYTVASTIPSDAGEYWMGIADPMTGTEVTTVHATLTVNPDSTPPTVVSAKPDLSLQHVQVQFSEGIDPTTAQNPANYQVTGGAITVTNATLLDLLTVDLQMAPEFTAGSNYDLILSGIQDQSGNTLLTVTQAIVAPNLVTVALYDAGISNNPVVPPDPSETNGGRWILVRGTNELLSSSAVAPDGESGFNAWNITDNTTQAGETIDYRWSFPKASHDFARTNGWRLKVRARFVDDFSTTTAMLISYGDASGRRYFIFFDVSGIDLDLTAALGGGITTNLTTGGAGAFDYHTHEIVFDPETQRASYYFDGTLISSGWNGTTPSSAFNGPQFGAFASAGMGSMNYNQVKFSAVNATSPVIVTSPVDATVAFGGSVTLTGSASGFVGGYQWYKDGVPIDGARSDSYAIASATDVDEGQYTLGAYNSFTEVQSAPATLTVGPMISIGTTNGNVMVTFTGTLESSTNVSGVYTDVTPTPTSPLILSDAPDGQLFFRSRK